MSKYDPLRDHLERLNPPVWGAHFRDVEHVLGFRLPPSARKFRAWWSNNAQRHVMTRAWLAAGYKVEEVDMARESLKFRKAPVRISPKSPFGALRGSVRIVGDIIEPTHEAWDAQGGAL